ncbi:MAG: hypothetical protein ACOCU4_03830 [Alkalispirochaeta sp.]
MNHPNLRLVRGYALLLRGLIHVVLWVAALAILSAIITVPLWFAASRVPTLYSAGASLIVVAGAGWLLVGGRRLTVRTVIWTVDLLVLLAGIVMGWPLLIGTALILASGMVAHRLA